jgi:CBS domain-containing protein
MIVADIMTPHAHQCSVNDNLDRAARLMWEHDCGAIPIVDLRGHTVGMITDRDICMAAYLQGKPLHRIGVKVAGSHHIHSVTPDAPVELAYAIMKRHRVRRLPVIDVGGNLVGMLSLADVVRHARRDGADGLDVDEMASVLAEVYRPSLPACREGNQTPSTFT